MNSPIYEKIQEKYEKACKKNSLPIVKYLLETPSLRNLIEIDFEKIKYIFEANNYELGDYLLNQSVITQSQKEEIISHAFAMACCNKDLKNVKDLFYNEKYKNLISLDYNSTWCFRTAYSNKRKEVLEFLITEVKIPKDNEWVHREMFMIFPGKPEMKEFCQTLYLHNELLDKLPNENKQSKVKPKI
jgi:hypothetical protein